MDTTSSISFQMNASADVPIRRKNRFPCICVYLCVITLQTTPSFITRGHKRVLLTLIDSLELSQQNTRNCGRLWSSPSPTCLQWNLTQNRFHSHKNRRTTSQSGTESVQAQKKTQIILQEIGTPLAEHLRLGAVSPWPLPLRLSLSSGAGGLRHVSSWSTKKSSKNTLGTRFSTVTNQKKKNKKVMSHNHSPYPQVICVFFLLCLKQ